MTNTELISKIKAEIERRVDILATVSVKQEKDGDSEMSTYYHGKAVSLEELLSFLSTLESEKPMSQEELEEEINRTYHDGSVADTSDLDHNSYENIARHFYELGCRRTAEKYDEIEYNRQRAEESVPKDLEEAAKEYLDKLFGKGKHQPFYKELFIAGAKWQKELMMEDAVEGEVCGRVYDHINVHFADGVCKFLEPKNISHIPADVSKYKVGDKVRVIIVKE